jgi:hypothetical protein
VNVIGAAVDKPRHYFHNLSKPGPFNATISLAKLLSFSPASAGTVLGGGQPGGAA